MWQQITKAINEATDKSFQINDTRSVGGGCINQCYKISGNNTSYFVKLNRATQLEMFIAEAVGLQQMYDTQTITIPEPICWGTVNDSCYLVLQWLDLGSGNGKAWELMGSQLAQMHKQGTSDRFGWDRDNTIGSTPQINTWEDNWSKFFAEHRIGYQLKLAKRKGGSFPDTNKVIAAVTEQLADRNPQPSLVHGDLWSGNAAVTADGEPVILDPATYYGDREVDIGMTEMFGGFPAAFYQGYNQTWQLDSGYQQRKTIYNLYHILNHFNIFGGGYGSQAQRMIRQIL
ncbi:fructosamine kinase family protein [Myxosarcina sp. GI1]|uniref:fructosamine kinase family protein n=1 Tax=Myxosarcina sp. GI1 TaxID=1541065 RepID=UPI00055C2A79|nr:fructosamine kinase family protein [Myxosarcina sp. GI1]